MAETRRTTKVHIQDDVNKFGQFANAFRVVEEVGPDCFLDFMIYSADLQEATVVSRVRVRRDFLPHIRNTLTSAMEEFPGEDVEEGQNGASAGKNGKTLH